MSALIFHVVGSSGRKSISFLSQLAYNSGILSKFAAREPAKPLNDVQMCGSFLFLWVYGNEDSVYKNIFHAP